MTRDADNEGLGSLAALSRQLPRDILPPPDLWAAIAARLEPRGRLDHLAASLPTQIDPPQDLWPEIEARIGPHRRMRRTAVAVAVCVAVATAIGAGVLLGERHDAPPEPGSVFVATDDTASAGASAAIDFGWTLDAPAVAGDVAANLGRELALVRDERLSIERAIDKDPDNVDLRELWAFAYETELRLADACGRTAMEYQRERG
jgi:hypothetical protein